jgi:hypothetical protein
MASPDITLVDSGQRDTRLFPNRPRWPHGYCLYDQNDIGMTTVPRAPPGAARTGPPNANLMLAGLLPGDATMVETAYVLPATAHHVLTRRMTGSGVPRASALPG